MGESTAIGWTDHTFNPWWGCARVSPGCEHCYAEAFAKRTGHAVWGKRSERRFFGDKHWAEPVKWNAAAEAAGVRRRVFCASMADVFEDRDDLGDERARLWALIEDTPHLDWQLLTKRPENVLGMVPPRWVYPGGDARNFWPVNAWIGCTVEDQQRADERVPELLRIPAPVRFLSCEPLLGPVDLTGTAVLGFHASRGVLHDDYADRIQFENIARAGISWVIVGGESGPGHRPMNVDHARALVAQCEAAGVPVFFKQVGGRTPTAGGDQLDGRTIKQFPKAVA